MKLLDFLEEHEGIPLGFVMGIGIGVIQGGKIFSGMILIISGLFLILTNFYRVWQERNSSDILKKMKGGIKR